MAVRVRLKIWREDKVLETVALVNSGYEADSPQLMIPISLAKALGIWPPPPDSKEDIFETAGGPSRVWVVRKSAKAMIVAEDVSSKEIEIDLVVSPHVDEPLISDVLTGEFEIVLENVAKGLWRFSWDPPSRLRKSEKRSFLT
jgi:hypothetical protein